MCILEVPVQPTCEHVDNHPPSHRHGHLLHRHPHSYLQKVKK